MADTKTSYTAPAPFMNNFSRLISRESTTTSAPAVIPRIHTRLMLSTIACRTSACFCRLKLLINVEPAPAIAAWISDLGTVGRSAEMESEALFKKTVLAIAREMVAPPTCAQVMKPMAIGICSLPTLACATEKEAWTKAPAPMPARTV